MNISSWWYSKKEEYWDRLVITNSEQDHFATYAGLHRLMEAQASQLEDWGVKPQMKVVLLFPSVPGFLSIFLAVLKVGAIPCPINPNLTPHELKQILDVLSPDLAILDGQLFDNQLLKETLEVQVPCAKLSTWTLLKPNVDFHLTPDPYDVELEDVACILCTSGTTGLPKAVMLTHDNLLSNVHALRENKTWQDRETFGNALPTFHIYGLTVLTLVPIDIGATVVYMPPFSPQSCLNTIQHLKISCFGGVPSMFAMLNKYRKYQEYSLDSCKHWVSGGAPLPDATVSEFAEKYSALIYEGYGMLEASPGISWNLNDDNYHRGAVGQPLKGVTIEIRNKQGDVLPQGETGLIWVQSAGVMKGYYRNPEATLDNIHAGWLATGDMGRIDEDGYLYLMGREKHVILVGGHNVYPREVETILLKDQAVADAAVVSRAHGTRGEEILAVVVPSPGTQVNVQNLQKLCQDQLSSYKRPKKVFLMDHIIRNDSGKVLQHQLLERIHAQESISA